MFYLMMNEEQAKKTADALRTLSDALEAWGAAAAHQATLGPSILQTMMNAAPLTGAKPQAESEWAVEAAALYVKAQRASLQAALDVFRSADVMRDVEWEHNPFGVTGMFTATPATPGAAPQTPKKSTPKPRPAAKAKANAVKSAKPSAPAAKAAATKAAPKKANAKPAAEKPKPARAAKPAAKAAAKSGIAALLDAPRGAPDDLTAIKGIGPKLNDALHAMGIYHYWQIAALKADDIAWINERLRFKNRVERERWVPQAKALAGDTTSA